ncbi:MAG: DoxX family membrane protein [bacterium]|nr:DoxX family membrane protein [bacterium]
MNRTSLFSLLLLRLSLGLLFLYAGLTKVTDPAWSAAGYLQGAKSFTGFFQWFAQPEILPVTNFLNEWGLTLIGAALILGVFVRLASLSGVVLMLLYYLPLSFPFPNAHSFIIDEHIVYIAALLVLASLRAGRFFGLEKWCASLPLCSKFPRLRAWLG